MAYSVRTEMELRELALDQAMRLPLSEATNIKDQADRVVEAAEKFFTFLNKEETAT